MHGPMAKVKGKDVKMCLELFDTGSLERWGLYSCQDAYGHLQDQGAGCKGIGGPGCARHGRNLLG